MFSTGRNSCVWLYNNDVYVITLLVQVQVFPRFVIGTTMYMCMSAIPFGRYFHYL